MRRNLGQPGQQSGQFNLCGVRLITELVKDERDRRRYDGGHGSIPMITVGVGTAMITVEAVPVPQPPAACRR